MKRLLVPVLGAAALALSTQASAQQFGVVSDAARVAYVDDGRQPYYEARRVAYDNGYREGTKQGERDARDRRAASYQDDKTWQRADKGYNRSFGDFSRYQQQFRAGYAEGYQATYGRYAPTYGYGRAVPRQDTYGYPGGGYGYPSRTPDPYYNGRAPYGGGGYYGYDTAYPNGMRDGVEKGREDARKHRSYDPLRHSWYRSGDHDYHKEYGPKQRYEDVYRQGFKEGYDRGFRELGYR
jgi:flagellar biosynthesis/type III secretory pathway protein FliH